MSELNRIPSPTRVQSLGSRGAAREGKPRLERRPKRKKGEPGSEEASEAPDGLETPGDGAPPGTEAKDPEDEERGKHVDVRA